VHEYQRKLGQKQAHALALYLWSGSVNWRLTEGLENGDQRRPMDLVAWEGLYVYVVYEEYKKIIK